METNIMKKREFAKTYYKENIYKEITSCAIGAYILAAIGLVIGFVLDMNSVLDAVIVVALGLWLQFGLSFPASIILMIYSIFNCIILLVTTGRPGGYLYILLGIFAIKYTNMLSKEYKRYKEEGQDYNPIEVNSKILSKKNKQ